MKTHRYAYINGFAASSASVSSACVHKILWSKMMTEANCLTEIVPVCWLCYNTALFQDRVTNAAQHLDRVAFICFGGFVSIWSQFLSTSNPYAQLWEKLVVRATKPSQSVDDSSNLEQTDVHPRNFVAVSKCLLCCAKPQTHYFCQKTDYSW